MPAHSHNVHAVMPNTLHSRPAGFAAPATALGAQGARRRGQGATWPSTCMRRGGSRAPQAAAPPFCAANSSCRTVSGSGGSVAPGQSGGDSVAPRDGRPVSGTAVRFPPILFLGYARWRDGSRHCSRGRPSPQAAPACAEAQVQASASEAGRRTGEGTMNTLPRFHGQPIQHHAPSRDGSVGPLGCTMPEGEDAGSSQSSFQSYVERLASHAPRWTVVLRCARPGRTGVRRSSDTAAPTQRLTSAPATVAQVQGNGPIAQPVLVRFRSICRLVETRCGDGEAFNSVPWGWEQAWQPTAVPMQAPARSRVDYTRCPPEDRRTTHAGGTFVAHSGPRNPTCPAPCRAALQAS